MFCSSREIIFIILTLIYFGSVHANDSKLNFGYGIAASDYQDETEFQDDIQDLKDFNNTLSQTADPEVIRFAFDQLSPNLQNMTIRNLYANEDYNPAVKEALLHGADNQPLAIKPEFNQDFDNLTSSIRGGAKPSEEELMRIFAKYQNDPLAALYVYNMMIQSGKFPAGEIPANISLAMYEISQKFNVYDPTYFFELSIKDLMQNPDKLHQLYSKFGHDQSQVSKLNCMALKNASLQIQQHDDNLQENFYNKLGKITVRQNDPYLSEKKSFNLQKQRKDLIASANAADDSFEKEFSSDNKNLPEILKIAKQHGLNADTECEGHRVKDILDDIEKSGYLRDAEIEKLYETLNAWEPIVGTSPDIVDDPGCNNDGNIGPLLELQRSGICNISEALTRIVGSNLKKENIKAKMTPGSKFTHQLNSKDHDCEISVIRQNLHDAEVEAAKLQPYKFDENWENHMIISVVYGEKSNPDKKDTPNQKKSIIIREIDIEKLKEFEGIYPL